LTQETHEATKTYVYDDANRLIEVDGVPFIWDDNGNLIQDNVRIYHYDHANRLDFVSMDGDSYNFEYRCNGKSIGRFGCESDRVSQTVSGVTTNYVLDQAAEFTQVLSDGMNTYLYGASRIGEEQPVGWQYPLGDALGSMRQLVDQSDSVTLAQSYKPYGSALNSDGSASSIFQFTGEQLDGTGLVYLRARYYASVQARFLTRDEWNGDPDRPISYNKWLYGYANPVIYVDASGYVAQARPCTGSGFCQLDDAKWGGVVIDGPHFFSSMAIAERIISQLEVNIGRDDAPLTVSEINIRFPTSILGIEGSKEGLYEFGRNYLTSLPRGTSDPTIRRIGLGIFMNYQLSLEGFQALIDPRCAIGGPFHCSGFSNEDLPSDYLGYIAVTKFGKSSANPDALNLIVEKLGGGHAVEARDPIYKGDWLDAWRCSRLGHCDENNPYNVCFTAKIYDKVRRAFVNVPWPDDVVMDPIGQGEYWRALPGFSLRIFPLRDE
jgi:RHS repeat-associated protein